MFLRSSVTLPRLLCHRWASYKQSDVAIDPPEENLTLPLFHRKSNEDINTLKSRLVYQSRKRGMLENCLILSNFAAKHLPIMNKSQLDLYDKLINAPSNDWDLYYWATGIKETPKEFESEVMDMLKEYVKNPDKQSRIMQPDL
ncbi:hypothetical protein PPYR_06230 [Photinus pyralis]|uniref:Succinate dehydrogenase assembly factor 2, mitochondrial n=1 Tax=Photinus pyralis TaxID=7054 RepID=A0A5N4ATD5_PHOPY|nr:succinate dehydrogenase assembly factor 2, mitochondrial-like [Photinus pyralis]KAB0800490.1 hypothetical protein PPYR_06230 [Photinus pyralis]